MRKIDHPITVNDRQQRIGLWSAGIFTAVNAALFGTIIYAVFVGQKGKFGLEDAILLPVTALLFCASLLSFILIRRGKYKLGTELLFITNMILPIIGTLLLDNLLGVSVAYILIFAPIMYNSILHRSSRRLAIVVIAIVALLMIGIEIWNPGFRGSAEFSGNIIWVIILLAAAVMIGYLVRQAWRGNIRTKLITSFAGVAILSMAMITFQADRSLRQNLTKDIIDLQAYLTSLQGLQIGEVVNHQYDNLISLSTNSFIQSGAENAGIEEGRPTDAASVSQIAQDWKAVAAEKNTAYPLASKILNNPLATELKEFQRNLPDHAHILLTDYQGLTIAATDIPSSYYQADALWWRLARENGKYIGQPIYNPETNSIAVDMAIPVYSETSGEIVGVLRSTINFDLLTDLLIEGFRGQTGYSMIYHPHDQIIKLLPTEDGNFEIVQQFASSDLKEISEAPNSGVELPLEGVTVLASSAPVGSPSGVLLREGATLADSLNWKVISVQEKSEALQPVSVQTRNNLIIAVIIGIVVIAAAYFLADLITSPIVRLNNVASRVASGDLHAKAKVETNDEIGTLATTFNSMTSQLRGLIGSLEQQVANRTRALETSSEVSRRLSTILDPRDLVREVVEQVQSAFDYYHTQIYLFDENKEKLMMVGGTGEAGKTMLEQGHSVPKGRGLVGRAGETNLPVLVPSVERSIGFEIITPDTVEEIFERESTPAATSGWYANHISNSFTDLRAFAEQVAQKKASGGRIPRLGYILYGSNDFLDSVKTGAEEASQSLGIDMEIVSANFDPDQGIRLFREMIEKGKNGLIVQPDLPEKWILPIQQAVEAGIPVLTTNLRCPSSAASAWFGQDSYQSGLILSRELQKALAAAGKPSGKIVVASARDLQELHERYTGLQRGLQDSPYTLSEFYDASLDAQQNYTAWERLVQANPDMVAAVGLASVDLPSLIRLKKRFNAQWVAGGYDLSVEVLEAIRDGIAQVAIGQHPYLQGYLPVLALGQHFVEHIPLKGWIVESWQSNPLLPKTRAEVAVPIAVGENVLGVLDVQEDEINVLDETDVDLLQSIANQVAVALQNARAYQHTQQQVAREALIANINQQIRETANVEEALKVTVRELGRALGSDTSVVLHKTESSIG